MNGAGVCKAWARMSSDAIEEDFSDAGQNDEKASIIEVLETHSSTRGASWQCRGLVLRAIPAKQNWFRRVGTFEYHTSRNGQKTGESAEDWKRRVALDFDWFGHKSFSTVTIV